MALPDKPCRRSGYQLAEIEGERVLFFPGRLEIMHCNQTASLIWRLCNGQYTIPEMAALLGAAYPEVSQTIAAEVKTVLQRFDEYGALSARSSP